LEADMTFVYQYPWPVGKRFQRLGRITIADQPLTVPFSAAVRSLSRAALS